MRATVIICLLFPPSSSSASFFICLGMPHSHQNCDFPVISPEVYCFFGKTSKETTAVIPGLCSCLLHHLSPTSGSQSHLSAILFPRYDCDSSCLWGTSCPSTVSGKLQGLPLCSWPCDPDKGFGPRGGALTLEGTSVPTNHILPPRDIFIRTTGLRYH